MKSPLIDSKLIKGMLIEGGLKMESRPLGPIEALKLALEKEIEARQCYTQFSNDAQNIVVRDIFIFLANEEEKHRKLLENKINELTK
jgi:rubrerythrin